MRDPFECDLRTSLALRVDKAENGTHQDDHRQVPSYSL